MENDMRADVHAEVLEVLAAALKFDPAQFREDVSLAEAGVGSLDLVSAAFAIEERFDISIPFNANDRDYTTLSPSIGQLLEQVVDLVMAQRVATPKIVNG